MPTVDRTLDPTTLICCCWQISVAGIELAIDHGERSLSALANGCGAGSGCGSCRGQVSRILRRKLAAPNEAACVSASETALATADSEGAPDERAPDERREAPSPPVQPSLFNFDP